MALFAWTSNHHRFRALVCSEIEALLGADCGVERLGDCLVRLAPADPRAAQRLPRVSTFVQAVCSPLFYAAGPLDPAELAARLRDAALPRELQQLFAARGARSFALHVRWSNRRPSAQQRAELFEQLGELFDDALRIDLRQPDLQFYLLQEFDARGLAHTVFGVVDHKTRFKERACAQVALSARPVLGPTTLDEELASAMCNLARVHAGCVVLDPFCGSGGLLIAAAQLRALCVGGDFDRRLLRGWGILYRNKACAPSCERVSVATNFAAYALPKPDLVLCRAELLALRAGSVDAVVSDPPYGRRACASAAETPRAESAPLQLLYNLIDLAHLVLRPGGRLVFLFYCKNDAHGLQSLEAHWRRNFRAPHALAFEPLSSHSGRYCITLEKRVAAT